MRNKHQGREGRTKRKNWVETMCRTDSYAVLPIPYYTKLLNEMEEGLDECQFVEIKCEVCEEIFTTHKNLVVHNRNKHETHGTEPL